ncbi:MAG: hypothetical protein IPH49_01895 [Ignavibacteria bacterium]|nr:hypothetical protein [Ignavibacteria bacterium]
MRPVHFLLVFLVGTIVSAQTMVPIESIGRNAVFAQGKFFLQACGFVVIYDTTHYAVTREALPKVSSRREDTLGFAPELYRKTTEWTSATTPLVEGEITNMIVDNRDAVWMFNRKGDVSVFDGVSWETMRLCPQHNPKLTSCISDVTLVHDHVRVATCSGLIDINVSMKVPHVRMPLPYSGARVTFLDDEQFVITTTGLHCTVDMRANAMFIHNELSTLGIGSDTSNH